MATKLKPGQWSINYKKCKECGTTKAKHRARGLCANCYTSKAGIKERAESLRKQAKENPVPKVETPNPNRGGRPEEWTKERIEQEAQDLEAWSLQEDALILEEFGLYRNPPYIRKQMYDLGEKSPRFSHALMVAKERIRSRREKGGVRGTFNPSMIQFTHSFYDRPDNDKDVSFSEHKKEQKVAEKAAEGEAMAKALAESHQYVKEAEERLKKKKEEEDATN